MEDPARRRNEEDEYDEDDDEDASDGTMDLPLLFCLSPNQAEEVEKFNTIAVSSTSNPDFPIFIFASSLSV